jgi:predicted O-methyltransferase YrrM
MAARTHLWRNKIEHYVMTNETSVISYSRNGIAERLNQDYLMWIDSDMQFPGFGITRLMDRDKDIIGGLYFRKTPPHEPLAFSMDEGGSFRTIYEWPTDSIFQVSGVATGFMLIKKKVIDAFTPEVVKTMGSPFDMARHPVTHKEEGEDLSFCRRALKLGFEIWCDPTIPLGHLGKLVYTKSHYDHYREFNAWQEKKQTYTNDIDGWMTATELNWLHDTAKQMESIVEIGAWKGRSTHALLSGCKGTVWAVDHFQGSEGEEEAHKEAKEKDIEVELMKNVGHFPNLKVLRMASVEAAKQFEDKSVDMVFIDGGHTYKDLKADIEAWLPKAKKLICGHDWGITSVEAAVTERFGIPDTADSIWIHTFA